MTEILFSGPVAVLGTGIIGAAMARVLARSGAAVRARNRTPDKLAGLAADGVTVCADAAAAVQGAAVIVTALTDGPATQAVLDLARPGLIPGQVWAQTGTVGPQATDALAVQADALGLVFYDAPVLGTRQPAEQGTLTVLAAGPERGRAVVEPVFDAIGQRTLWVADQPGAASRLKLALNAYVFALPHGTAETLRIAGALGVDPALVMEAVRGGPLDSGYFQGKGAAMLAGDFTTSFTVDNGAKDTRLVLEALAGTGLRADLAEAGLARFLRASAAGHGSDDIAATVVA
ncbi:NAD(P)-dependent oxidoreductase [Novispirillum itersonii]|uniref:3-hydroxyisobutyrate dehydrogenase n=1 Tax=Novispirillum itersonii TaxID=189 RepID=A0A7X0DMJ1_NOVIT|nr:NAD(P)-dependent oxidoreductase [Novispirillum itersonii]MBB6211111.1 3-hydroxyisobutyrate dehydrogenase [Novispirillum itersonii]